MRFGHAADRALNSSDANAVPHALHSVRITTQLGASMHAYLHLADNAKHHGGALAPRSAAPTACRRLD